MGRVILLFLIAYTSAAQFPENWERCRVPPENDNKRNSCIERTIASIVKDLSRPEGKESLGMRSMDPLRVKYLKIGRDDPGSPVRVRVEFFDSHIIGLSTSKIKSVKGKLSSTDNWNLNLKASVKKLAVIGNYKINGQILILPIVGEGRSNLTLDNTNITVNLFGKPVTKNGREHLKVTSQTLRLETTRLYLNFENLFNGDKLLSDNMNRILNENWEIIFNEMKTSMESEVIKSIVNYAKVIPEKIPFNEFVILE